MKFPNLKNTEISVIGLGKSGLASCRLLKNKGARVFASDNSSIEGEALNELKALDIDFELGGHTKKCFEDKDFIVVSPGVPFNSPPLNEAKKKGIPVYSEIELGFWFIDAPIVAVTGTNGKTTTTALIGEMLKAIGKKVSVCGNIGLPLSKVAIDGGKNDVIAMEVSSFQLETIRDFRPRVSVLLNITPNHLDRYSADFSAYAQAKANLFKNQRDSDFAVLNKEDEIIRALTLPPQVKKIFFSVEEYEDGNRRLFSLSDLKLRGRHNLANALAAYFAVSCLFPEEKGWIKALREFKGLPHRLEVVREIKGITFVNDSKSTSVDATLKAIESISGPIILIAGGRDKESPFGLLKEGVNRRVKKLILFGESKDKMAGMLKGSAPITKARTLEEATVLALRDSVPGDYVLLSPACASFDMFKNFEERGEKFRDIVLSLL